MHATRRLEICNAPLHDAWWSGTASGLCSFVQEVAYEYEQKYKEGKFILECVKLETESGSHDPCFPGQEMRFSELGAICP